ncbi:hypothetical protein [Providencia hangzhouensis]
MTYLEKMNHAVTCHEKNNRYQKNAAAILLPLTIKNKKATSLKVA